MTFAGAGLAEQGAAEEGMIFAGAGLAEQGMAGAGTTRLLMSVPIPSSRYLVTTPLGWKDYRPAKAHSSK